MRVLITRLFILLYLIFPVLASAAVTPMVAVGSCCTMALKSDGTVMRALAVQINGLS